VAGVHFRKNQRTLGAMRKALELETTAHPAAAKRGSISRAYAASMEAKMIFWRAFSIGWRDRHARDAVGERRIQPPPGSLTVGFPLERSLAASHATSNQG